MMMITFPQSSADAVKLSPFDPVQKVIISRVGTEISVANGEVLFVPIDTRQFFQHAKNLFSNGTH